LLFAGRRGGGEGGEGGRKKAPVGTPVDGEEERGGADFHYPSVRNEKKKEEEWGVAHACLGSAFLYYFNSRKEKRGEKGGGEKGGGVQGREGRKSRRGM